MERNPVGWFEIYAGDIERAKSFYEAVLGVTLEEMPSPAEDEFRMFGFPGNPESGIGTTGALASMPGGEQPNGNGTIVYFSCEDCAVEAGRAEAAGGSVMKEKFSIGPYGFVALVNDTEGNVIGLHSMQ
jgi:predicted enzyme related to lactoylglutathione lyase